MTPIAIAPDSTVENLLSTLPDVTGGPAWAATLRAAASRHFAEAGLPTTSDEEWRLTNIGPITQQAYRAAAAPQGFPRSRIAQFLPDIPLAAQLVFINGHFNAELSARAAPGDVRVSALGKAIADDEAVVRDYLGQIAPLQDDPFGALNSAALSDGVLVHVAAGVEASLPIHALFITDPGEHPVITFPRVLVVAEANARVTVIETHAGFPGGVYFSNAVTEVHAGPGARVEHVQLQRESLGDFHMGLLSARLAAGATLSTHVLHFGGALVRNNVNVLLNGDGAEATLNGLTITSGRQLIDNRTILDHAQPHCPSHELYKAVMDGRSKGIFRGRILVRPGAQKTDSKQNSKTLLLSDDAVMDSQPQLEIYADDVKCTHGSTTGPLDDEQIFYLRARGVELPFARDMLTYAFATDVVNRIGNEPLRDYAEKLVRGILRYHSSGGGVSEEFSGVSNNGNGVPT